MNVTLCKAALEDCAELQTLQAQAFQALTEKYRSGPGVDMLKRIQAKFRQPETDYYFICLDGRRIGGMRVFRMPRACRLKQVFILPDFQGFGYGRQALQLVEALYPDARRWELDTVLQEEKLCRLYESLGYRRTGRIEHMQPGQDLVYYAKEIGGE